ncbi:YafY family protein [Paenibacillus sp.]|jgi:predicted DNA-binding transcriptional regulator YafY|uniref:helix-turn-helix transcriptional regulator n=1 Tax=Paenibacillus sp. TaxID=58172 RepID=UPI0028219056|nr:YafY family protein [Paenibacillus sp.]MDR0267824.1 YafY family transcriptional regulator [Paenibacillus sp.]
MAKIDNMMAILWMLNSGRKITAKQISEKLEMNIRTVYRYIDALSASGVPIISDTGHNGGYTLLNHFIESPLLFDVDEQTALLHAAAFAKEAGYFSGEALNRATSKLTMYSNQEQEKMIKQHVEGLEVISPIGQSSMEPILKTLEQGIVNELSVEMEYHSGREEEPKRRIVDPYGIIYWNNNWYVIAFCHLRHEIRSFRVGRIINIIQTELTFNRPTSFSAGEFFMKNQLPEVEDKQRLMPLVVGGKTSALDNLCQHWFLGHHVKERTSKEVTFLLEEEAIHTYVPYLLLPYGKSIQVIQPASLKQKLIDVLYELIDYYQA